MKEFRSFAKDIVSESRKFFAQLTGYIIGSGKQINSLPNDPRV